MVFSSTVFLFLFLPAVLLLYYSPLFRKIKWRNMLLFFASIAFYAWGEPLYIILIMFSLVVIWGIGQAVSKESKYKKIFLIAGIVYLVGNLVVFKYLSFILSQIGLLFHFSIDITIEMPIGISFFTFQMLSYILDVYYGKADAQKNIMTVGLYAIFFPQMIAGPIVRYADIAEQIKCRKEAKDDLLFGMERFIWGLGKKVLLANYLAQIADNVFDWMPSPSVATAWIGALAYALQIYYDFSGYSDMAIGLGRMFGFHFQENFNYPYISKSVTEFWRRWHISLSQWFRDYVYIPLGGNRKGRATTVRNLFIVWLLTGIWHGANWTFVLWGINYFVLLALEKLLPVQKLPAVISHIYTLIVVVINWVIFRADSVTDGLTYIGHMFGIGVSGFADIVSTSYIESALLIFILGIIFAIPWHQIFQESKLVLRNSIGSIARGLFMLCVFALSIICIVGSDYNPFIYFNF